LYLPIRQPIQPSFLFALDQMLVQTVHPKRLLFVQIVLGRNTVGFVEVFQPPPLLKPYSGVV
jgi:hypothetical protein